MRLKIGEKRSKLIFVLMFILLLSISNVYAYELLIKSSDTVLTSSPREAWSDAFFDEERRGNTKQGYIIDVKPAGWNWENLEKDPSRFVIVRIPDEDWNESWLEPEYDYDKPIYDLDTDCHMNCIPICISEGNDEGTCFDNICYEQCKVLTGNYEILTERKYRLPLESFLSSEEISWIKNISCDNTTIRPAIIKEVNNIADLIIYNDWLTGPWDWVRSGDNSCEHYASLGKWSVEGSSLIGYPRYARDRSKFLLLEEQINLISEGITLEMPKNILIKSENLSWDGNIVLPTLKQETSVDLGGAEIGKIIKMGFANVELNFDKAVKITIPSEAGSQIGISNYGTDFSEIITVCGENTQEFADSLPAKEECKIDVGDDLIVWTKHFTEFITYKIPTLPEDYISYLKFEENTLDEAGINNGAVYGNPRYVDGVSGKGIDLAINDYVNINSNNYNIDNGFAYSAWVNIENLSQAGSYYILSSSSPQIWMSLVALNRGGYYTLRGYFEGNYNYPWLSKISVTPWTSDFPYLNKWIHLAFTRDEATQRFYINGILADIDFTPSVSGITLGLGKVGYNFGGIVDEVMFYNRSLSEEEIQQIYCAQGGESDFC